METLHQKGANGLVAEYQCALTLARALEVAQLTFAPSAAKLESVMEKSIERVAGELSSEQLARAKNQGRALGDYIFDRLQRKPSDLGLTIDIVRLDAFQYELELVGRMTSSGDSADVILRILQNEQLTASVPVSLKAYRGSVSSLGSKGARASLCRLFLDKEKVEDRNFTSFFGAPAVNFLATLKDFKAAAREFYSSDEGVSFVNAYEQRKGSRKVNNPLRRKEVGDYFFSTRGRKSEHIFAEQYVDMFRTGMDRLVDLDSKSSRWARFISSMKFVLGMDNDILTLNAIAGEDGIVRSVTNSYLNDAYANVRRVLLPGCIFTLSHKDESSIIGVEAARGGLRVRCLSLAMWKDATIQFKLDSKVVEA